MVSGQRRTLRDRYSTSDYYYARRLRESATVRRNRVPVRWICATTRDLPRLSLVVVGR